MNPLDNITKEEFAKLELPIGTTFRDFSTGEKLKVVATCCGAHMCDGCFYNDNECTPNGKEAIAPLCSWIDREDGCNVKFVKASEDHKETEVQVLQSMAQKIKDDYLSNTYPDSIVLEGLDEAIIGISTNGNVIYSVDKIISIFVNRDNMTIEEATEYFDYNVERALPYMNDGVPPILMNTFPV